MNLSKRLKAIADMVTPNLSVADIGADHGYVPIYLLSLNKIPHAVAADISPDCISKARINSKKSGVFERMNFKVSWGMDEFEPDEADSIIICGMGGNLICSILEKAYSESKLKGVKEIIASPHRDVSKVREILKKIGFKITDERLIKEDAKFYFVIKAENIADDLGDNYEDSQVYNEFGKILLVSRDPVLKEFLENRQKKYIEILSGKIKDEEKNQIEVALSHINQALNYFES